MCIHIRIIKLYRFTYFFMKELDIQWLRFWHKTGQQRNLRRILLIPLTRITLVIHLSVFMADERLRKSENGMPLTFFKMRPHLESEC